MAQGNLNFGAYKNISATAQVTTRPATLLGFYVNSTSSGTIRFYDGTGTAGTVVTNTITPAVGWHSLPVSFTSAIYAVIASTLDVTLVYA
jgi:hypothetical protein